MGDQKQTEHMDFREFMDTIGYHSYRQIAKAAGVNPASVANWKTRGKIPIARAQHLIRYFTLDHSGQEPPAKPPSYRTAVSIRLPMDKLHEYTGWPTTTELARLIQVNTNTIRRWNSVGIPYHQADHIAVVVLGVHPSAIWGNDLILAHENSDRIGNATDRLRQLHDEIDKRLDRNPDTTAYSTAWLAEIRDTLNETLAILSKV